jgi:T5SS/PEP-CTERM-associated repeat protein
MKRTAETKSWCRGLSLAIVLVLSATRLYADPAYTEDFSSGSASPNWSGTNLTVSQATGGTNTSWYLGQLADDSLILSLTGLDIAGGTATPNSQGQHTFTTVSYDLFIIGGWQGNNLSVPGSPNTFTFGFSSSANSPASLLTTTFSNDPGTLQTFPYDSSSGFFSQPGGKGANQINSLGFTGAAPSYDDSVYQMAGGRNQSFTFDHNVDDLTLNFSAANLAPGATWGLTNLKIVTGGIFTWQAAPSIGDGLDGGWDISEHWLNPNGTTDSIPGPDDAVVFDKTDSSYFVSIHQAYSAGFFRVTATQSATSGVQFNTIGHNLTLTAGDYNNASLAVADGPGQVGSLFLFNSNNDADSNFNGVINAETVGIARGVNAQGTLTLDGYLDPAQPGASGNPLGNVILNVQREMTVGDARYNGGGPVGVATLNILHGAVLNSGLGGGSASSNPADGNPIGFATYVDGTVNVDDHSTWNQTEFIWIGVSGPGALNVTNGSQVNVFQLPFAGQTPAIGGTLSIGGFAGSSGSVTVKDPGSQINAGFVQVGTTGVNASLWIDNLGVFNGTYVSVGSYTNGFSGPSGNALVNVTHLGQLNVTTPGGQGQLNVGDYFDGTMTLGFVTGTDGSLFNVGLATADFAIIGNNAGVNGEVDVSYAQAAFLHSLFTVNKTLTVGAAGHGSLVMNGGGVTVVLGQGSAPGTIVTVGDQAGSYGLISLGGGSGVPGPGGWAQGSTLDASAGGVVLGNAGFGRLEAVIGGQAFARTLVMAQQAGSVAEVLIDGDVVDANHSTLLKVSDYLVGLTVGQAGNTATVDVNHGGLLDTFRATVGGQNNNMAAGTVTLENAGSLWLVHGQSFGSFFAGGTLDIGGDGLGGQHGGSGVVTVGAGSQLGVEVALQLAKNGMLVLNGGSVTVGTANPLLLDSTPNRLHIVANTTLNLAFTKVYGQGVIEADVLLDSGAYIGPNGSVGGQTGTLRIVGSYHELAGGNLSVKLEATGDGHYDTVALLDSLLVNPAGDATFDNGAGVTLIGEAYTTPLVGDYFDVLTAGNVNLGSLDLTFVNLPTTNWFYGVVSVPGGEALRIEYGTAVPEPASLFILGSSMLGLLSLRRKRTHCSTNAPA